MTFLLILTIFLAGGGLAICCVWLSRTIKHNDSAILANTRSLNLHTTRLDHHDRDIASVLVAIKLVKQRTTWLLDRAMAERTAEWKEIDQALTDFRVSKGLQELEDQLARIHEAHHPESHEPGS